MSFVIQLPEKAKEFKVRHAVGENNRKWMRILEVDEKDKSCFMNNPRHKILRLNTYEINSICLC